MNGGETRQDVEIWWITGQSGAGKTTLGNNLKTKLNDDGEASSSSSSSGCSSSVKIRHFDGDLMFFGHEPEQIFDSNTTPPPVYYGDDDDSKKKAEDNYRGVRCFNELKTLWTIVVKNCDDLFKGKCPRQEEWRLPMEAICSEVSKRAANFDDEKQENEKKDIKGGHDDDKSGTAASSSSSLSSSSSFRRRILVVSFSVYPMIVRDLVREFIPSIKFIILNDCDHNSAKRKFNQFKSLVDGSGLSVKDFTSQYRGADAGGAKVPETYEEVWEQLKKTSIGLDDADKDKGEYEIKIKNDMDADCVYETVKNVLEL